MAGFHDLPVELAVAIMKYADTPQDTFAMIRADPWLLHCLLDNRKQVMTPYTTKIKKVCGGHVSTAYLLAARLRHAKQDPAFNDTRPQHREQMVSQILQSCIRSHNTHHHVSHRASLATICELSTLAIDVGWLTTSYVFQALKQIFGYYSQPKSWPRASFEERQRFINAACRFEGYVQAFFHMEQPLFPRDESIRRLLFSSRLCGSEPRNRIDDKLRFYSIAYYVYDQNCTMMKNINRHLSASTKAINGKDQDNAQVAEDRQKRRLQNCKQIEVNKCVHYLTSEGLGMLLRLQSMALEDQSRFVLSNFESILDSPHPNVLMVHGIDLYKIGTVEKHRWSPWVDCEDVFEITPEQWKWAESFWDVGELHRWSTWW
ncbi:hypothetical protein FAGAP_7003 [Fusarium agapanthi]|uniref:Uncharacterized protein n=1 Tax=Fusarium agapanthi TaxID=1803897 RepID=A0A9P5B8I6_9HYPO|nr:hypothetical protein FAGAP_7003 [Fusarium agapanthi]